MSQHTYRVIHLFCVGHHHLKNHLASQFLFQEHLPHLNKPCLLYKNVSLLSSWELFAILMHVLHLHQLHHTSILLLHLHQLHHTSVLLLHLHQLRHASVLLLYLHQLRHIYFHLKNWSLNQ